MAFYGPAVVVGAALFALLASTRNVMLASLATLSVLLTCVWSLGFFQLLGWKIGVSPYN